MREGGSSSLCCGYDWEMNLKEGPRAGRVGFGKLPGLRGKRSLALEDGKRK